MRSTVIEVCSYTWSEVQLAVRITRGKASRDAISQSHFTSRVWTYTKLSRGSSNSPQWNWSAFRDRTADPEKSRGVAHTNSPSAADREPFAKRLSSQSWTHSSPQSQCHGLPPKYLEKKEKKSTLEVAVKCWRTFRDGSSRQAQQGTLCWFRCPCLDLYQRLGPDPKLRPGLGEWVEAAHFSVLKVASQFCRYTGTPETDNCLRTVFPKAEPVRLRDAVVTEAPLVRSFVQNCSVVAECWVTALGFSFSENSFRSQLNRNNQTPNQHNFKLKIVTTQQK